MPPYFGFHNFSLLLDLLHNYQWPIFEIVFSIGLLFAFWAILYKYGPKSKKQTNWKRTQVRAAASYARGLLLFPVLVWADPQLMPTTKQAEKLFRDQLYGDAIPLYSKSLAFSSEDELKSQLTLRLATCYLEEREPLQALALLSSMDIPAYRNQCLYLMSLAYRQADQSLKALNLLQQCSLSNSHHAKNLIALEQGYHFFHLGDFVHAQEAFQSIPWQTIDPTPHLLAQLQLAKLFLINNQSDQSLQTLQHLSSYITPQNILYPESIFLKGWALLARQQPSQAAICFEKLLPKALISNANWSKQVLNGLIISYLRQALAMESTDLDSLKSLFSKTNSLLQQLLERAPTETSYLLLSDFYLIKAKCLSDSHSYAQAQQLLNQSDLFSSKDGLRQALVKRAAAAPSYQERCHLYEQLAVEPDYPPEFCAKVWFLKGLNDFEEGLRSQKQQEFQPTTLPFEQAAKAFDQVIRREQTIPTAQIALALKYQALAYAYQPGASNALQAWQILSGLIKNDSFLLTFEHPEEMYCLSAWIALHLADKEILKQARAFLRQNRAKTKSTTFWNERYDKLEGILCLQLGEWQQADNIFESFVQNPSYASSHGEAWFWRAYSADQQHNSTLKKEYLQQSYTQDPLSPYAPTAYFHFYSYREYMQGKRKAIKHLQAMPHIFPNHPLLISAYYLIGLHHKKDHHSEEGQLVRRKDLTTAIDAFQLAESSFDRLLEEHLIPSSELSYFIQIRYQSQLERALANLAIAQHSTGGKKQIYLEYAEEVFKQIIQDFKSPETLANKALIPTRSSYPKIWSEAEFQLAKTFEEKRVWKEAEIALNTSLEHYRQAQMAQSYGCMRIWYAKGKIAHQQMDEEAALRYFLEAEKAIKDFNLSPNEKLDLWIQQSLCYKALNQMDQSMRLLSRVINDDVISPLRIKAMFLRAEIYELQGRPELAIKQLEATSRKGGEWARQAKEKLEKIYGY